jgi:4-aminobutyrate aminotransferase-like enzyme
VFKPPASAWPPQAETERGLLRAKRGDAFAAWERGVIVIPAGEDGRLMSATPPLTITDEEIDEALERLG